MLAAMERCPGVPLPTIMSLHSPTPARFRRRRRSLGTVVSTLVISSMAAPGLGVALRGATLPAHAHANRCITIKETTFTTVTSSTLAGDPHLHCLRIEANTLLNDLDLDGLSRLNHLIIKNNNDLRTIDLTKMTNLTYLRIDNNDNLETINFLNHQSYRIYILLTIVTW